jgi:hypothetical protein
LKQVTDLTAIEKVVDDIIAGNHEKAEQAKVTCADRLVRRSGHEGIRRQGQSADGHRVAQAQARFMRRRRTRKETDARMRPRVSSVVRLQLTGNTPTRFLICDEFDSVALVSP